jgi:3-isopropylmalate/(R)-2-methylmalate dehydratase small subunit
MLTELQGKVWVFGDNIDTDQIALTAYSRLPLTEMKFHVLERIRPEFGKAARPGDIIVAGENFGCGSSRETAPVAIKELGIAAVVAESFARIFFRNAVAIGLPAITCPGIRALCSDGDMLKVNIESGAVLDLTNGRKLQAQVLPLEMLEVLTKGGIRALLQEMKPRHSLLPLPLPRRSR